MNKWESGDIVTFTMTGRINYKHGEGYSITADQPVTEGYWHPETTSVVIKESQILGTPEQAKRARIMAIIEREYPDVKCEPMRNSDTLFALIFAEPFPTTYQRNAALQAIQDRIVELETQI